MAKLNYIKLESLDMKTHPELDEKWLQARIAEDPGILGLGDLNVKDIERKQPRAGRLDILLQDSDSEQRYEVEIQLGATDESHIIRTLEYWDIERKRYPQYEHTAVIVAEDITSRFLNVISLLNGFIPLIALRVQAVRHEDNVALVFTKVLDQMILGLDDDDDEFEVVDRAYWEQKRGTKVTMKMADEILLMAKTFAPNVEFKYNKAYIGVTDDGQSSKFLRVGPQKSAIRVILWLPRDEGVDQQLDASEIDYEYLKWGRYRLRMTKQELSDHRELIQALLKEAYQAVNA